jgi:hypothetical protein
VPPFSDGDSKFCEPLAGDDDKSVPPPNIMSPCWAAAKWVKHRNAKTGVRSTNFLKRNLQKN